MSTKALEGKLRPISESVKEMPKGPPSNAMMRSYESPMEQISEEIKVEKSTSPNQQNEAPEFEVERTSLNCSQKEKEIQ